MDNRAVCLDDPILSRWTRGIVFGANTPAPSDASHRVRGRHACPLGHWQSSTAHAGLSHRTVAIVRGGQCTCSMGQGRWHPRPVPLPHGTTSFAPSTCAPVPWDNVACPRCNVVCPRCTDACPGVQRSPSLGTTSVAPGAKTRVPGAQTLVPGAQKPDPWGKGVCTRCKCSRPRMQPRWKCVQAGRFGQSDAQRPVGNSKRLGLPGAFMAGLPGMPDERPGGTGGADPGTSR